jgi:hypothetical protein
MEITDREPASQAPGSVTRDEVRRLVEAGAQLVEVLPRDEFDDEHLLVTTPDGTLIGLVDAGS